MTKFRNKRSVTIARHRTSITLEDAFWTALAEFADADGKSVAALIGEIDKTRGGDRAGVAGGADASLSAAIRVYVLERARSATRNES